MIFNITTKV